MARLLVALAASAATVGAFAPVAAPKATTFVNAAPVKEWSGVTAPFGFWDPVGFADRTPEPLMLWFRASELKHSRVAMLACAGWIVQANGITFPGNLAKGIPFNSLGKDPIAMWEAVPYAGKLQMLIGIGLLEFHSEFGEPYKKHYTKGGPMPGNKNERWDFSGDVLGIAASCTPEELKKKESSELNNGRLAMIAIMGFSAAALVPGSVPF